MESSASFQHMEIREESPHLKEGAVVSWDNGGFQDTEQLQRYSEKVLHSEHEGMISQIEQKHSFKKENDRNTKIEIYSIETASVGRKFPKQLGIEEAVGFTLPPSPPVPKDKLFLVWLVFLLNSGGYWLAWNLMNFLGPSYYFDYWFSNIIHVPQKYATDFLNALGMLACSPLFAMGYIAFLPLIPFTRIPLLYRYFLALAVYIITVMTLLIATCTWTSHHKESDMGSFFTFSVTVILIMMGAVGVYQSYLYGMAADLPRIYTSAIVIGTNAGGVLASLLYIICTPSKETGSIKIWNSEVNSAKVYYSVTFGYLLLCAASVFVFWRSKMFRHFMKASEEKSRETGCDPRKFCKDFGEVFCEAWSELLGIFMIFFTMYAIFPTLSVGIQPGNTPGMAHLPKYFLQIGTFLNFYSLATIGAILSAFIHFPTQSKKLRNLLLIPSYLSMYLIVYFMFCNFHPNLPKVRQAKVIFKGEWWYFIANGFLGLLTGLISGILMPLCSRVVRPELRRLAGQMALASLLSGLYLGAGMTPGFIAALTVEQKHL